MVELTAYFRIEKLVLDAEESAVANDFFFRNTGIKLFDKVTDLHANLPGSMARSAQSIDEARQ
jgi:hypothetical protein